MFVWLEKSGQRGHLQIIENKRDGVAVRQRVIANLGRRRIGASGALAPLIAAGAKLTDQGCCSSQVLLTNALDGDAEGALWIAANRIGGPMRSSESGRGWGSVRSSTIV